MRYVTLYFMVWSLTVSVAIGQNLETAFGELSQKYEECYSRLKMRDSLITKMDNALKSARELKVNTDSLLDHFGKLQFHTSSLHQKYEKMILLSDSIGFLTKQNFDLSQASVRQLDSTLVELNKHYNKAARKCIRPWYLRWELFIGGMLSAAIGYIAGSI